MHVDTKTMFNSPDARIPFPGHELFKQLLLRTRDSRKVASLFDGKARPNGLPARLNSSAFSLRKKTRSEALVTKWLGEELGIQPRVFSHEPAIFEVGLLELESSRSGNPACSDRTRWRAHE